MEVIDKAPEEIKIPFVPQLFKNFQNWWTIFIPSVLV